jgi:hypothetical protein
MPTFTRPLTALFGTAGTPTSIAANGTQSGSLTVGSANNNGIGGILTRINIGTSLPGTNPTIQYQCSIDGTTYFNDGQLQVVPITTASVSYDYPYTAPLWAVYAQVLIVNGTTNAITAFAQAVALAET